MKLFSICHVLILLVSTVTTSDNLTITFGGEPISMINKADFTTPLYDIPLIDEVKYDEFLSELDQQVSQQPINATLNDQGEIIPEQMGYKLNRRVFTEHFYSYFFNKHEITVEAPRMVIYPKVDSELLSQITMQKIGHYTSYFRTSNKERSHNISLAVEAINNHVVFPGETFSFNEVVGKRTTEKGYLPAPVIVRGELSEGIGGGICQVSSTLFNAVDSVGVQILERYSHSRSVPYVPPGRDATVSWYGPDFTFKNKYNQPILIRAKIYGGSLHIMIYSSDAIEYQKRDIRPKRANSN